MEETKSKPSFLLNKGRPNIKSSSKISKPSVSSIRLQRFGRTYQAMSPLISRSLIDSSSGSEAREMLAQLTKTQEQIMKDISDDLDLDFDDSSLEDDKNKYELSKVVSEIISDSPDTESLSKELPLLSKKISEVVCDFLEERKDLVSERDLYLLADKASTNLKIAALPATLSFYRSLKSICVDESCIFEALKQQIEIAVLMAKDVCFNHDPNATLWDRELLFVSLLSPCMYFVQDSWFALFNKTLKAKSSKVQVQHFVPGKIAEKLSKLRGAIEDQDMGHAEIIDETLLDISRAYSIHLDFFFKSGVDDKVKSYLINKQIKILDSLLSKAWQDSIESIRSYVESLSEEDMAQWIETEGSKPMDLLKIDGFFNTRKFKASKASLLKIRFEEKDLAGESFYRLIQAWGLTDTLCKMKSAG